MTSIDLARAQRYPLGASTDLVSLERDPYPLLTQLQRDEPFSWIEPLGLWYVTRYDDVREIAVDHENFTNVSPRSPIVQTFGEQMLNSEGDQHRRFRAAFAPAFSPSRIRDRMEGPIREAATRLIADFSEQGMTDLRQSLASRLPVLTMLALCGMPDAHEPALRRWYDLFGESLANFKSDPGTFERAKRAYADLNALFDEALDNASTTEGDSLLHGLVRGPEELRLERSELRRNLAIVLFGGISTVEALILTTLWALLTNRSVLSNVSSDLQLLSAAIDETARWHSPVQSATRFVVRDIDWHGHHLLEGQTVNCMLGAANRDPRVFARPECFDISRPNVRRHLAFATGPHACIGFQLARTEARIALEELLVRLPGLALRDHSDSEPTGAEFHQPRELLLSWRT